MKFLAMIIELTSFAMISVTLWIVVWIAKSRGYESVSRYLETLPKNDYVPVAFLLPLIEAFKENVLLLIVTMVILTILLTVGKTIGDRAINREAMR
jgi:hypothetical protein